MIWNGGYWNGEWSIWILIKQKLKQLVKILKQIFSLHNSRYNSTQQSKPEKTSNSFVFLVVAY